MGRKGPPDKRPASIRAARSKRLKKELVNVSKTVASSLCKDCSQFTLAKLKNNGQFIVATDLSELLASTDRECEMCTLVRECLQKNLQQTLSPVTAEEPGCVSLSALKTEVFEAKANLRLAIRRSGIEDTHLNLWVLSDSDHSARRIAGPYLRLKVDDGEATGGDAKDANFGEIAKLPDLVFMANFVRSCIAECNPAHKLCDNKKSQAATSSEQLPIMPTRVLDLKNAVHTGSVRLWHTEGAVAKYTALSYTWGGDQAAKTVLANVEARCSKFAVEELPLTIRDAIKATAALDIRYLWVDALCIIQDSSDDWTRESAKMGDVYHHSWLTIAASRGTASTSGFLGPRKLTNVARFVRKGAPFSVWPPRRDCDFDLRTSPLYHRGWGMQERLLSPRMIHFTESQIYWECWTMRQTEDFTEQQVDYSYSDYPLLLAPGASNEQSPTEIRREWERMVSRYSELSLTFQSDKLHAIAGLAKKVAAKSGWNYTHGMWKEQLHHGVLWMATGKLTPVPEVRAPSWSWASHKGPVRYMDMKTWDRAEVTASDALRLCTHDTKVGSGAPEALQGSIIELIPGVSVGRLQTSHPVSVLPWPLVYQLAWTPRWRYVVNSGEENVGWVILDSDDASTIDLDGLEWIQILSDSRRPRLTPEAPHEDRKDSEGSMIWTSAQFSDNKIPTEACHGDRTNDDFRTLRLGDGPGA